MNHVQNEAADLPENDLLSSLPLDLVHHILSLMDTKYAVQTCVLSSKWKHIWTTLRDLKFSTFEFEQLGQFSRFTRHVIANRDDQTDVSSIELTFEGTLSQILIKVILNYVVAHNVHRIKINTSERDRKIPICIFESQSLKHLSLINISEDTCILPQYPWELPNLTTLHLHQIVLCDGRIRNVDHLDLFSKLVNLKHLEISQCYMADVKFMDVSAPRLENLTVKDCFLQKLYISAPNLSSFVFNGEFPLIISTNGLKYLEKVDLHLPVSYLLSEDLLSDFKKEDARQIINLFRNFHSAEFFSLNSDVIEALSLNPDLLSSQPSPFNKLKHMNIIQKVVDEEKCNVFTLRANVKDYFLHSSPTATITTEVIKINEQRTAARYLANQRNRYRYLAFLY